MRQSAEHPTAPWCAFGGIYATYGYIHDLSIAEKSYLCGCKVLDIALNNSQGLYDRILLHPRQRSYSKSITRVRSEAIGF
jgi:hypothetical protein